MKYTLTPITPSFCLDASKLSPTHIYPPKTEGCSEGAELTCRNCVCYNDGVCVDGEWEGECATGHYCAGFTPRNNNIATAQKKMNPNVDAMLGLEPNSGLNFYL